jgi:hypothetical protein
MSGEPKESFANVLEVLEHLQEDGWKISKPTLYRHVKDAKLQPAADGSFTRKAVQAYARTHLQLKGTRQKQKEGDLQRKKTELEIDFKKEQLKRERFKREIEEGKYIPREDMDLELAARATVQDHEWTRVFQSRASEICELVEGKTEHVAELIRFLLEIKDEIMNEFASTRQWYVLFEAEEE